MATVVADRFASILPEVPHQRSVYPFKAPQDGQITGLPHSQGTYCVGFSTAKSSVASAPIALDKILQFCGLVGWIARRMGGAVNTH